MFFFLKFVFLLLFIRNVRLDTDNNAVDGGVITTHSYVFWPNATIPFYINPEHFDREQSTSIMTTLALFAFKTCLKFLPVLAPPEDNQHVLVLANPDGKRQCSPATTGHPMDEPHTVVLGYDCLRPPLIEMMLMKALGFPFEHNRASRDLFIDVQLENVDPSEIELFTKESILPLELRSLAYDIDSAMHFGERDFSKNGHRTIIFKDRGNHPVKQNRVGLSPIDLRKIEIVYGPECRKRDRQEKIELCQNYPGVLRRKREVTHTNLRVNRDITPPPNDVSEHVNNSLVELGIENEVQVLVDQVYKVSSKALKNARAKYCNGNDTKSDLRVSEEKVNNNNPDILGIIGTIADYARNMVDIAVGNLTEFCRSSGNIELYQRARCPFFGAKECPQTYKSTKSGPVRYSTQHRPIIIQSTKHEGRPLKKQYVRSGNDTEDAASSTPHDRRKRHADMKGIKKNDSNARREEEATTVQTQRRSENDTNSIVNNDTRANDSSILRSPTDKPDRKRVEYEAEWPFPDRHHRRHYKSKKSLGSEKHTNNNKKKLRSKSEWDDSNISVEDEREKRNEEKERRNPMEKRERESHHREKNRLREQPESEENSEGLPKIVHLSKENREFYNERKWPDGIVRYIISDDTNHDVEDVRRRLAEVNSILKRKTCVKLEEITEDEAGKYQDYLVLDTGADFVTGKVGGRQHFGCLELFRGGQHRQHAAMMVMSMLGFYFELARHDRDHHVRVHLRHVRPDKLHHFEKIRSDATFPLPYDYKSATHPAWQFWRKVGIKGISSVATFKSKDPEGDIMKSLGQNEELFSEMDIIKINSVYGIKCFQNKRSRSSEKKKQFENIRKHHGY